MSNTIARSKKPFSLALAGVVMVVALLAATLGNSPGATAAPAAQQNIVQTAAAAGQFTTLLSSPSRPVSSVPSPERAR